MQTCRGVGGSQCVMWWFLLRMGLSVLFEGVCRVLAICFCEGNEVSSVRWFRM